MLGKTISKNSLILGAFAAVTAGLIASTFVGTKTRIEQSERAAQTRALNEIVPHERHDNELLDDTYTLPATDAAALGIAGDATIHIARKDGEVVAFIVPATAPDGYSGDIKMIVGINTDGTVAGVRVLAHKETPGLGDKVDLNKSRWVLAFDNTSLQNPSAENWAVKKDGGVFDQFTGATITPRAVVRKVKETLVFFQAQQESLMAHAQSNIRSEGQQEGHSDE